MTGEDWAEKVRQYRLAVYAYCDAVDRIDSASDAGPDWQQIEAARDQAERARSALLPRWRKPLFTRARNLVLERPSDEGIEELVLGDVGQLGG